MKKLVVLLVMVVVVIGVLAQDPPREKKIRWDIGWPTWPFPKK